MPLTGRRGRVIMWTTAVLSVLVVGSFGLAAWSFSNGHRNACQARDASLDVTRDILLTSQGPTPAARNERRAELTPPQRRQYDAFYTTAFARIAKARC